MKPRNLRLATLLIALLSLALSACDGGDCSERPDPAESEEKFVDRVEDYMDDADANSSQTDQVVALARSLTPVRAQMRKRYEPHRKNILDQMLSEKADPAVIKVEVEKASDAILWYSEHVIDKGLVAHALLTAEQRKKLVDELSEPPDPFEIGWKESAAVDLFLIDIDATSAQKVLVKDRLVDVEKDVREVQKKQHRIRLKILEHVSSDKPNAAEIKALVRRGGTYSVAMIQSLTDLYIELLGKLTPAQRDRTRDRLGALRRCPAT